jgi:hypothetical protein
MRIPRERESETCSVLIVWKGGNVKSPKRWERRGRRGCWRCA